MTTRSRVLLIVSGLIIFMIAAPSIVLLARGFRYDFSQNRIVETGTLVVKTEPRGARVFLNGEALKTTPLTYRFLKPGEYSLEIQKDNYFPWKKRITVHAQQVITINSPDSDEITLFLSSPVISVVATSTADFLAAGNGIFYLRDSAIYRTDQQGEDSSLLATSTLKLTSARILSASYNRVLIEAADKTYYFSGNKQIQLPSDFDQVMTGPTGETLYASTAEGELVQFDPLASTRKLVANSAKAFALFANDLYYISEEGKPKLYQLAPGLAPRLLADGLPQCANCEIIFTEDKQIFLLLDQTLYKLNNELEKVNSPVLYAYQNPEGLIYGNNNEVWLYRTLNSNPNELLTRISQKLGGSIYNKKTSYLFVSEGREIKAIEFDGLGQANVYTIAETKNTEPKFSVNGDGTHLTYLENGSLITLQIR